MLLTKKEKEERKMGAKKRMRAGKRRGEEEKGREATAQHLPGCDYHKIMFPWYLYQTLSHNPIAKARFPTLHCF